MVKVRDSHPVTADGVIDINAWIERLRPNAQEQDLKLLQLVTDIAQTSGADELTHVTQSCFEQGINMAEILAELNLDTNTLAASILFPLFQHAQIKKEPIYEAVGPDVAHLLSGAEQMNALRIYSASSSKSDSNLDRLRKMLLAMIEDARVILIKLAEQVCVLRAVKDLSEQERRSAAIEARDIYAPLANRLGVGHIKWELEDLAFRYLEPATYKRIAKLLDERRVDRQRYLTSLIERLQKALQEAGIDAQVNGRVKHIYSIWRKMQRKNAGFEEIYDVRAVRILVNDLRDCYSALGIVHGLWPHIPQEFDDYIATPKENGYRSLHTAVNGPQGKVIEVQIRTQQMHQESELGVAAHWRYKEGVQHDASYENKIAWLRQLLDWQEEVADARELVDEIKNKVIEDRIYVLTPNGDVLDLPVGATPLDFAYSVHTQVGHRCRGAKISGRIVPLTTKLQTGQQVEILTGNTPNPSRDWMNPNLGYVCTSRARAKIQQWFKLQNKDERIVEGKAYLDKELQRLDISEAIDLEKLASKLNVQTADDVLAALATGDIRLQQILNAAQITLERRTPQRSHLPPTTQDATSKKVSADEITIQGVGNLLTQVAGCCQPLPGEPIVGYVTQGRGVTIHRQDCTNILNMQEERCERLMEVDWGSSETTYPVNVCVEAFDRQNLLRDMTVLLANERINLMAMDTKTDIDENKAITTMTMQVPNLARLSEILDKLAQLPNVISVRRQS